MIRKCTNEIIWKYEKKERENFFINQAIEYELSFRCVVPAFAGRQAQHKSNKG